MRTGRHPAFAPKASLYKKCSGYANRARERAQAFRKAAGLKRQCCNVELRMKEDLSEGRQTTNLPRPYGLNARCVSGRGGVNALFAKNACSAMHAFIFYSRIYVNTLLCTAHAAGRQESGPEPWLLRPIFCHICHSPCAGAQSYSFRPASSAGAQKPANLHPEEGPQTRSASGHTHFYAAKRAGRLFFTRPTRIRPTGRRAFLSKKASSSVQPVRCSFT